MQSLQQRIAECMRRRPDLSQADIARACRVRTPSVADWINGKTKTLKPEPARLGAALFGCDQNWLATGTGRPRWHDTEPHVPGVAHSMSYQPITLPQKIEWESVMSAAELPGSFVVAMPDDALAPRVMRGTELIFEPDAHPRPGVGVLIQDKSGRRCIRQFAEGANGTWLANALAQNYYSYSSDRDEQVLLAVMTGRLDGAI